MHLQKAVGPFHLLVVKDERIGLEPPPPPPPNPCQNTLHGRGGQPGGYFSPNPKELTCNG